MTESKKRFYIVRAVAECPQEALFWLWTRIGDDPERLEALKDTGEIGRGFKTINSKPELLPGHFMIHAPEHNRCCFVYWNTGEDKRYCSIPLVDLSTS